MTNYDHYIQQTKLSFFFEYGTGFYVSILHMRNNVRNSKKLEETSPGSPLNSFHFSHPNDRSTLGTHRLCGFYDSYIFIPSDIGLFRDKQNITDPFFWP